MTISPCLSSSECTAVLHDLGKSMLRPAKASHKRSSPVRQLAGLQLPGVRIYDILTTQRP
jgi:hypothetical protein